MYRMREMAQRDLARVMAIWLAGNKSGHPFVAAEYWEAHYAEVEKMLPEATVFVWEDEEDIKGFAGCLEGGYLAGIFVDPLYQGAGIGHALLSHIQANFDVVNLHVYQKNQRAIAFYKQHGFVLREEQIDGNTQEIELEFCYTR